MAIAPPISLQQRALARFEPSTFEQLHEFAKIVAQSQLFGVKNAGGALVVMMAGAELGFGVTQSLQAIHLVKGKPVLSSDALAGLAVSHPSCRRFQVIESTHERCVVEVEREGWDGAQRYSFDADDAKRAGLWGRGNWKTYPADMLRARATARAARTAFPDATMGIYVEEHGEYEIPGPDQLRAVVDNTASIASTPEPKALEAVPNHTARLKALLRETPDLTDALRREWCAWLCKKRDVGTLAEIPVEKLAKMVAKLEAMDGATRAATVRESLGIDDRDAAQLAHDIGQLVGECTDVKTAERYLDHLAKAEGVETLAQCDRAGLLKLATAMAGKAVAERGPIVESEIGEWDAARMAFFAAVTAALAEETPASRSNLKDLYKAHVVGDRPSMHAMSPDQIRGEADYLTGMGAGAAAHIKKSVAPQVF